MKVNCTFCQKEFDGGDWSNYVAKVGSKEKRRKSIRIEICEDCWVKLCDSEQFFVNELWVREYDRQKKINKRREPDFFGWILENPWLLMGVF